MSITKCGKPHSTITFFSLFRFEFSLEFLVGLDFKFLSSPVQSINLIFLPNAAQGRSSNRLALDPGGPLPGAFSPPAAHGCLGLPTTLSGVKSLLHRPTASRLLCPLCLSGAHSLKKSFIRKDL